MNDPAAAQRGTWVAKRLLAWTGGRVSRGVEFLGGVAVLSGQTFRRMFTPPFLWREFAEQIERIGIQSMAIVVLTAIFSSMVMTIQFAVQLARFGAKEYVANVVALSLARELGPVLTALMVGGRVGAGIAAEIGSMNVTEQIDAIRVLGADPVRKLVVPRVSAAMLLLPLMTAFAVALGVGGAMLIARAEVGVSIPFFYNAAVRAVTMSDFLGGIAKTIFFGYNIAVVACYMGMNTRGGTAGVGASTTKTVVITSIVTLMSDFVLTKLLMLLEVG